MSTKGRPRGARNIRTIAESEPSRCQACGSSRRSAYENCDYRDYSDRGLEFVGIWYRTCRCLDCGQSRRDREKVYAARENNRDEVSSSEKQAG